ncbi:hypothetical protein Btru_056617 [Bulinus truncatus]|nr:hypothetical protein Btru_056617 [Bulinus truncatus]
MKHGDVVLLQTQFLPNGWDRIVSDGRRWVTSAIQGRWGRGAEEQRGQSCPSIICIDTIVRVSVSQPHEEVAVWLTADNEVIRIAHPFLMRLLGALQTSLDGKYSMSLTAPRCAKCHNAYEAEAAPAPLTQYVARRQGWCCVQRTWWVQMRVDLQAGDSISTRGYAAVCPAQHGRTCPQMTTIIHLAGFALTIKATMTGPLQARTAV